MTDRDLGFVGTLDTMSNPQLDVLKWALGAHFERLKHKDATAPVRFHHGDRRGCDMEAASIAKDLGYYIVGHPALDDKERGFFFKNDHIHTPIHYRERFEKMVKTCHEFLACPFSRGTRSRSGTWQCMRMCVEYSTPLTILTREGTVLPEEDAKRLLSRTRW